MDKKSLQTIKKMLLPSLDLDRMPVGKKYDMGIYQTHHERKITVWKTKSGRIQIVERVQ